MRRIPASIVGKTMEYSWWGGVNEPPPHLKTKKQLAELGLKPVYPVGVIRTKKYNCYLYDPGDINSAAPKRECSPSQRQVLREARRKAREKKEWKHWEDNYSEIEIDRAFAVRWARKILASPDKCVILDTETTGLGNAEIVEIAIVDLGGNRLLDTLVKPSIPIPQEVTAIHGIDDAAVAHSQPFPAVYQQIADAVNGKTVLVYNLAFDSRILKYCCHLHQLPVINLSRQGDCIMHWYSQWVGDYSDYWRDYQWQPLGGGHRAAGDCLAALRVIERMASDSPDVAYPPEYPDRLKLY